VSIIGGKSQPGRTPPVGVAWYTKEEWTALRERIGDEALGVSYEDWLATATEQTARLEKSGVTVRKVAVVAKEFFDWCKSRGCDANSRTRAEYVTSRLYRRDVKGHSSVR
jgi:hypothetical protein